VNIDNENMINVNWIDDSIMECKEIVNIDYENMPGFEAPFFTEDIKMIKLIPGTYRIVYYDGSSRLILIDKEGTYDFSS
jgi:hypothetical protein